MPDPKKIEKVKTLQAEILQRALSPEKFEKLMEAYRANRKGWASRARFSRLHQPLTPKEREIIMSYMNETEDISIMKKYPEIKGNYNAIGRIALKLVFQNLDRFKDLLEKGGE